MPNVTHSGRALGAATRAALFGALLCAACTKGPAAVPPSESKAARREAASATVDAPSATSVTATPAKLKLLGEEVERLVWKEAGVEHLVVLTKTSVFLSKVQRIDYPDDPESDCELRAYHFVKEGQGYKRLWLHEDAVRNCFMDVTAKFVAGSLAHWQDEGEAAISYIYLLGCRSDVSPDDAIMKVHRGAETFTLRGFTPDFQGPDRPSDKQATAVTPDPLLAKSAPALQRYMVDRWHCLMDYDSFWGQASCPPGPSRSEAKAKPASTP